MTKNIIKTMVAMTSPPPPPPPKSSRKTLIVVAVIVLIVVLAVGVYLATGGFSTNTSVTPTPTPIPGTTSTPAPTATPTNSGTAVNIEGASSLQFTVTMTDSSAGTTSSYTYSAKNAGTTNMMIRVEFIDPSSSDSFVYIVNGAQQKAWMQAGGQWIDLTSSFSEEWDNWDSTFSDYQNSLADWNGLGDWTYTIGGETISIHDIS